MVLAELQQLGQKSSFLVEKPKAVTKLVIWN